MISNKFTTKNANGEYELIRGVAKEHAFHKLGRYEEIGLDPEEIKGFVNFATLAKTLGLANEMDLLQIFKMGLSKRACLNCIYNKNEACANPLVVIDHNPEKGCWRFKKRQIEDLF